MTRGWKPAGWVSGQHQDHGGWCVVRKEKGERERERNAETQRTVPYKDCGVWMESGQLKSLVQVAWAPVTKYGPAAMVLFKQEGVFLWG